MDGKLSNLTSYILNGCTNFVHSLLPRQCALCDSPTANQPLCAGCEADLPRLPSVVCTICALPVAEEDKGEIQCTQRALRSTAICETKSRGVVCGRCLKQKPAFDHILAAFIYSFPIDRLLHGFKYAGNLSLATLFAEPLARQAAALPRPDLLLPMPLHPARLRERGFNQTLEIAKPIARWLEIPIAADICTRLRDTPTQAGLKWKQRQRNVRGAFASEAVLSGKKIVVLDDVMTTGATLNEISRTLKSQGAVEVSAWVVARAVQE